MKIEPQAARDMQHLADVLKGQRLAMLTLQEGGSGLCSRPMTPLLMDADGAIWFMASRQTWPVLIERGGHEPVNLAFIADGQQVSVSGHASLVDEPGRKQALWSVAARVWFSGPDDPKLVLLKVQIDRADIWDGPDNAVSRAIGMAASVLAGREIGLGHKDVVTPGSAG